MFLQLQADKCMNGAKYQASHLVIFSWGLIFTGQ